MSPKKLHIKRMSQQREKGKKSITEAHRGAVIIGTPYTIDKIREMLDQLCSKELDRALQAAITFMDDNTRISEAISRMPDISVSEVTNRVVEIIKENEEQIFRVIKENKKIMALEYLAGSAAVSQEVRERAKNELQKLKGEVEVIKPQAKRRISKIKVFTTQHVMQIWNELNSQKSMVSIKAAITVFSYYQQIARTLSKIPDITPTKMLEKAIEVTYAHIDLVYKYLYLSRQKNALLFMAQSNAVPLDLANRAKEVLKKIEGTKITATSEPMLVKKVKKLFAVEKEYLPQQVEQLWKNLTSSDVAKSVPAAIEFFSNYQTIAPVIMKVPLLTVTKMSNAATSVLTENSEKIFRIIEQTRNTNPLKFIAESSKIPLNLRKKAKEVLLRIEKKLSK